MKISRFIAIAAFGLGLISQSSFSYVNVDQNDKMPNNKMSHKKMKHHDKIECEKSAFPLFNKEENRPCKEDAKHEKRHVKKHAKKHTMCGEDCHRSAFPLFNKKENKTWICKKDDMKTDTMKTDSKKNYSKKTYSKKTDNTMMYNK